MQNKSDTATELTIDDSAIASQMGYARGKTLIKFILLIAIAISVFIAIAFTGIQYALNNLLQEKSNSLGMGWAHHLETQFPDAGQIAGVTNSDMIYSDQTKGEMAELIDGMFQVGNIYQLDLINPDCNCSITYGSYSLNSGQSVHKDHGSQRKPIVLLRQEISFNTTKFLRQILHGLGQNLRQPLSWNSEFSLG